MIAFVLAAGLGTRLRPFTYSLPKALVPIGDRPHLELIVDRLRRAGATNVVANASYLADAVEECGRRIGVVISNEGDEPLGTAGGLKRAARLLGSGDVLVHNGDSFTDVPLSALWEAHARSRAEGTLAVRKVGAPGEGNVGVGAHGEVVRLRSPGKPGPDERSGAEFVGVHVISAALRARLPDSGCLVGDVYLPALGRGEPLRAVVYDGTFIDVGTPEAYLAANVAWLGPRASYSAARASIGEGVTLDRAIVGEGAMVDGEGSLVRVVVWPGARATAPLADAVVMP